MSEILIPHRKTALGQVWTPDFLAAEMVENCFLIKNNVCSVLDPASGPATFSNQIAKYCNDRSFDLTCYDIDKEMAVITQSTHDELGIAARVINEDYLLSCEKNKHDLIIMNPPYIRHEKISIELKKKIGQYLSQELDSAIDKRSNIFIYFLLKGIIDLKVGGLMCCIVYDAISQSVYGKKALELLNSYAELVKEYKVKAPFDGAMIDAHILYFKKNENKKNIKISTIKVDKNLTNFSALINCRRGTGLPLRKLFIAQEKDPFYKLSKPFFIKQTKLDGLLVKHDTRAYLTEPGVVYDEDLYQWMKINATLEGRKFTKNYFNGVSGYILFNYYIRDNPRFLWNVDNVFVADNFYVIEPNESSKITQEALWLLLNSDYYIQHFVSSAKNQGNGLLKLQLSDFKNVFIPNWNIYPEKFLSQLHVNAKELISIKASHSHVKFIANSLVKEIQDGKTNFT